MSKGCERPFFTRLCCIAQEAERQALCIQGKVNIIPVSNRLKGPESTWTNNATEECMSVMRSLGSQSWLTCVFLASDFSTLVQTKLISARAHPLQGSKQACTRNSDTEKVIHVFPNRKMTLKIQDIKEFKMFVWENKIKTFRLDRIASGTDILAQQCNWH
jgi:hypothetical protein